MNRLWRLAFVLAVAALLYLALRPNAAGPDWFWQADKVRHAGAFAVLWCIGRQARLTSAWGLVVGLLVFGLGIEGLQALTPDREPSALDVCADLVGVLVGAVGTRWLRPAT